MDEILDALERIETKLDVLIKCLVAQEEAEAAAMGNTEIECGWCRNAGRVISNCPQCGGAGR